MEHLKAMGVNLSEFAISGPLPRLILTELLRHHLTTQNRTSVNRCQYNDFINRLLLHLLIFRKVQLEM
jgi:hypothetical protein